VHNKECSRGNSISSLQRNFASWPQTSQYSHKQGRKYQDCRFWTWKDFCLPSRDYVKRDLNTLVQVTGTFVRIKQLWLRSGCLVNWVHILWACIGEGHISSLIINRAAFWNIQDFRHSKENLMAINNQLIWFQGNISKIHSKPSLFQKTIIRGSTMDVEPSKSKSKSKSKHNPGTKRQVPTILNDFNWCIFIKK